jgi:hypothetical protein
MQKFAFLLIVACFVFEATAVNGFWWWTWSSANTAPQNTNLAIAFSGWITPATAIAESAKLLSKFPNGGKYISLGGGNANGKWTAANLAQVTSAINSGQFSNAGYNGIVYDIEEGDNGLAGPFRDSFAACKRRGLGVLVTVSHSAPYGVGDASALMDSFFSNANIDYLSPQLYTTGNEGSNGWEEVAGVTWSRYASAKAKIVPAIVTCGLYANAQSFLKGKGVKTDGFIQWSQTISPCSSTSGSANGNSNPKPTKPTPVAAGGSGFCNKASSKCGTSCTLESQCPGGNCWKDKETCPTSSAGSSGCPAGMCKSKWGFCGSGPAYCNNQRAEGESGLSGGAIAGIVIGSLCGVAILVAIVALVIHRRNASAPETV